MRTKDLTRPPWPAFAVLVRHSRGPSQRSTAPYSAPLTEYGAPYISEGFALLSVLKTAPFDVASALFNADVGNAALVIILCVPSRAACENDPVRACDSNSDTD